MFAWSSGLYRWSLIMACAFAAWMILYPVFPRITGSATEPGTINEQATRESAPADVHLPRIDIESLAAAHLFGTPAREPAAIVMEAPETRLQLRLVGLIASANDRYARALIGVNSGDVNDYGIGEDIADTQARVRSVEPRRVLLDRDGAVESLYLKTPDLTSGASGRRSSGGRNAVREPVQSDEVGERPAGADSTRGDEAPGVSDEDDTGIRYSGVQQRSGKQTKLPF